jgi:hypothetical protein
MSTVLIIDNDAGVRLQAKALLVADGFAVAGEAEYRSPGRGVRCSAFQVKVTLWSSI